MNLFSVSFIYSVRKQTSSILAACLVKKQKQKTKPNTTLDETVWQSFVKMVKSIEQNAFLNSMPDINVDSNRS